MASRARSEIPTIHGKCFSFIVADQQWCSIACIESDIFLCVATVLLISQLHHIIREQREHHEKVNACMRTTIIAFRAEQKIDCELFIWCIWSFMEYRMRIWISCHSLATERLGGCRFAVDIWQVLFAPENKLRLHTLLAFWTHFRHGNKFNYLVGTIPCLPAAHPPHVEPYVGKASTRFNELFLGICRDVVLVVSHNDVNAHNKMRLGFVIIP